ncbi:hypothetical protein KI387_002072, partial [Taxus chinensis]
WIAMISFTRLQYYCTYIAFGMESIQHEQGGSKAANSHSDDSSETEDFKQPSTETETNVDDGEERENR